MRGIVRSARFGAAWVRGPRRAREETLMLEGDRGPFPADLYRPPSDRAASRRPTVRGRLPAWIVLHGVTRPGRAHPYLVRFARALAATRAAVLVPEIPEWKELSLAPDRTGPAVQASIRELEGRPDVESGSVGLVGFSFGGPQALAAAGEPEFQGSLSGLVSWGGYASLERTVRFQFTGEHEWRRRRFHLPPDPYGRWVVGSNLLTLSPRFADAEDVARALRTLAITAGDRQLPSSNPVHDPLKEELRGTVARSRRPLFDLFAPLRDQLPDREEAEEVVQALCSAAREHEPLLDPLPRLPHLRLPVRLLHARNDQLIPFSETLHLRNALPRSAHPRATVTGLFAHSGQNRTASLLHGALEAVRFGRALKGVFELV